MDIYSVPKNSIRTNSGLYINVFDTDPDTNAKQEFLDMYHFIQKRLNREKLV